MKRIFLQIMILAIMALIFGCAQESIKEKSTFTMAETEPNNDAEQAEFVSNSEIIRGFIDEKLDQDWYKIHIPEDSSAILKAELTGIHDINLKMELFDNKADKPVREINRNKEGEGETLTNYLLTPGNYFLRVRELWLKKFDKKFNDSLAYHLKINLEKVNQGIELEPNDRAVESNKLIPGVPKRGYISPRNEKDWYKLSLLPVENQYLEITLTGIEDVDLSLKVYDPIEAVIYAADENGKGEGEKITNLGIEPEKEFYYIVVEGGSWQSNETSQYELMAQFVQTTQKVELEPNDRMVKATTIASGDTIYGFIDKEKDEDWYHIDKGTFDTQVARVEVAGVPNVDFQIDIINDMEETVLSVNETGEQEDERLTNIGLQRSIDYFVRLKSVGKGSNDTDQYSISLTMNPYSEGEEFELNNSKETANPIELERAVAGYIHPRGDVDFYRLVVRNRQAGKLEIILEGIMKVNTDMILYDEELEEIARAQAKPTEGIERITFDGNPGVYFIKVYDNDGKESNYRDRYKLAVFVKP